MSDEDMEK